MAYSEEELKKLPIKNDFRMRGLEMTRLETFIDAAFAFATTMLVISSGDIPKNYNELILALKNAPALFLSFSVIMALWLGHRKWSRRYGLENNATLISSLLFIFVLMIYVIPLRLVFSSFLSFLTAGFFPSEFELTSVVEMVNLFIIYGFGVLGTCGLMAFLNYSAKKESLQLSLNELEIVYTNLEIRTWAVQALTGFLSAIFALVTANSVAVFAGFFYMTFPITMPLISIYHQKKIKVLTNK